MSIDVTRRADGKPSYRVRLRAADGRHYSRTFRTRRLAEAFEASERTAALDGRAVDPWAGAVVLAAYADQWLAHRVGLRRKTVELYRYLLDRHILPGLGALELRAVTPARVRTWHADLGCSTTTKANAYRLLRTILGTAVDDELIAKSPCVLRGASVERPAERPVATVDQVHALAAAVGERYRAMILVAAWCGLRYGELGGLTRSDIDLTAGTVRVRRQLQEYQDGTLAFTVPKTDAGVWTVALPPHIVTSVEDHLWRFVADTPDAQVFLSDEGTPLRRSNFSRRVWHPARQVAGVPTLRFHDLRHTGNTLPRRPAPALRT